MGLDNIRKIMHQKGITSEQLARLSGIPKSTIDKIAGGFTNNPKYETVLAISNALNCSVDDFSGESATASNRLSRIETIRPTAQPHYRDAEHSDYYNKYIALDAAGRRLVNEVVELEYEKVNRKQETKTLIFPSMSVCAGMGNYLDDNIEYENIEVLKNKYTEGATHVIKLSGDSMEPEFHDKDLLIVKEVKGERPIHGRVGIFLINGSACLRQLLDKVLHPYNQAYKDMVLTEHDAIQYVGYVVGILDDSWVIA